MVHTIPSSSLSADAIANCVIHKFTALPNQYKPRTYSDGRREWVTLAGIVLSRNRMATRVPSDNHSGVAEVEASTNDTDLTCAALATGVKCLPHETVRRASGYILHDSHAEVLAIRAFNRWLIDECANLAEQGTHGRHPWLRWRLNLQPGSEDLPLGHDRARDLQSNEAAPFELHDDVTLHMYISEAPCGDASMELVIAAQVDASPWTSSCPPGELPGRGNFDRLGIVRRKPSRGDAPLAWSKSCSDKLAMKQCTSLLSSLTAKLVLPANAYLQTLVLPASQFVHSACERAFGSKGRMCSLQVPNIRTRWDAAGYRWNPFQIKPTSREFTFANRSSTSLPNIIIGPSNLATVVTTSHKEILIKGVRQGRKQFDPRGTSVLSRRSMWARVVEVASLAGMSVMATRLGQGSYAEAKNSPVRELVKHDVISHCLHGWTRGVDNEFQMPCV